MGQLFVLIFNFCFEAWIVWDRWANWRTWAFWTWLRYWTWLWLLAFKLLWALRASDILWSGRAWAIAFAAFASFLLHWFHGLLDPFACSLRRIMNHCRTAINYIFSSILDLGPYIRAIGIVESVTEVQLQYKHAQHYEKCPSRIPFLLFSRLIAVSLHLKISLQLGYPLIASIQLFLRLLNQFLILLLL